MIIALVFINSFQTSAAQFTRKGTFSSPGMETVS